MRDFEDSTLWHVSEFERVRLRTGSSGFATLEGHSVLPTTLLSDLARLEAEGITDDVLEFVAACMRHREPALLCLQYEGLVWPVTLFPSDMLYHSPRDIGQAPGAALARVSLLTAEPPGVRPPGHRMHDRVARTEHYWPLMPLLWKLATEGPRATLLTEISGTAAYRALRNPTSDEGVSVGGALGSAAERLRRETVSLRTIAGWPGMSADRATRLLNGLYLSAALLATRAHPAARPEPRGLRDMWRGSKVRR